ncbi:MAG TPA: styrene monooxygenase/indole monooxygenase family protein [Candidatus Binataceae bacterium]|nr:styrene monooxygenase/indole monooxygenase family protein [Candidatus Binataceae bacterium]
MRRIAIIGAGQAGLHLGFGLLRRGYQVTLFSDRRPEELLKGRAIATAFMFDRALSYERELGLNAWDRETHWGAGIHLDFCLQPGAIALQVEAALPRPGQAIDQRLKFARWMEEFERRGGQLIFKGATLDDLEQLAASHDLVVVAAGKGEIAGLFPRDDTRSVYTAPRRQLGLLTLAGLKPWKIALDVPIKFTFFAGAGEIFWIPFHAVGGINCYSLLFEAHRGGPMDRFGAAASGDEMIRIAREIIAEFAPWESATVRDVALTDPMAWAKGALTPTIRRPVGRLKSGRVVMGLGDTVVLNDPIAGQGSNHAAKTTHLAIERIVERRSRPFDADWMEALFEEYWEKESKGITNFSNLLLEPITEPAREILGAASQNPALAEWFVANFNEPQEFWPAIGELAEAHKLIASRAAPAS